MFRKVYFKTRFIIYLFLKRFFKKINSIDFSHKNFIIDGILIISGACNFENKIRVVKNVIFNNVSVGRYTYFAGDNSINYCSIGRYCSIAPGVKIGVGVHPSKDVVSTFPLFYANIQEYDIKFVKKNNFSTYSKIKIGNDVWIGTNAIILDGVSVGDGAIIGAGAVVTKDVEPYSVVGGVPAKLIRYRFDKYKIEKLLLIKWWDKEESWIVGRAKYFLHVDSFINNIDKKV